MQTAVKTPIEWAKAACNAVIAAYTPQELPPGGRWHYHQGVFLCGLELMTGEVWKTRYDEYIQAYVDSLVDEHGNFYYARDELDAIQPGLLLFRLEERTGDRRYRIAADKLRRLFDTLNKTSEGGFWHKDKYPYQMWLDGLYMGGVFALQYANAYGDDGLRQMVLHQESLMRKHMRDEATGLLYHAWDEKRQAPWANPQTGCSPEFWARSLGWYVLSLARFIELLPQEEPGRAVLLEELGALVKALLRYQDQTSGLWYQVVDKGAEPDNWLETSGSSLFVYGIAKAVQYGVAGEEALAAAVKGYEGLVQTVQFDANGQFVLPKICIGTSAGDYQNYVTRPTSENDLHGVGAFVMACVELDRALSK